MAKYTLGYAALGCLALIGAACGSKTDAVSEPAKQPQNSLFGQRPDVAALHPLDDVLRLNHIQIKGTHNSYHLRPEPLLLAEWDYGHLPLTTQLYQLGVRQIELDLHYIGDDVPIEIRHLPIIDPRSNCPTFATCLGEVVQFSDEHPEHLPLFVYIEAKSFQDEDAQAFIHRIEEVAIAAFGRDRLITPDEVRGEHATLREAIQADGWPTLRQTRGRVLISFIGSNLIEEYSHSDGQHLRGRPFFVEAPSDAPHASIASVLDPISASAQARIQAFVNQGLIVRSWADDPDETAAGRPLSFRNGALAAGSHILSTDLPGPTPESTFHIDLADEPFGPIARCHPVLADPRCKDADLERSP